MALDTYSDLSTAITDWLDDTSLSTSVDTFIRLAEARFNRELNTPDMEATTTLDGGATSITLPTDFYEVRGIYLNASATTPLEPLSLDALKSIYPDSFSGTPRAYAIDGVSLVLGPLPNSTCTITLKYKQKIPALTSSNTTNWLLTKHPDLYLFGTLVAAELRGWNDSRLPVLKSALDEALGEIVQAGRRARFGAGPLRMRAPVSDAGSVSGTGGNILSDGTDLLEDG